MLESNGATGLWFGVSKSVDERLVEPGGAEKGRGMVEASEVGGTSSGRASLRGLEPLLTLVQALNGTSDLDGC